MEVKVEVELYALKRKVYDVFGDKEVNVYIFVFMEGVAALPFTVAG